MIYTYKYIIVFWLLFGLSSCAILPNYKKGFNVYENPIKNNYNENRILTNGVYGCNLSKNGVVFYFYTNGIVKVIGWTSNFFQNADSVLNYYSSDWRYYYEEDWGQYSINYDTLTIQVFNRNNQEFFKRQVIEDKCLIINDSSFVLFSSINCLYNMQFVKEPVIYKFYPTELKPDSTIAWFNDKKWFKENLHESRRCNK